MHSSSLSACVVLVCLACSESQAAGPRDFLKRPDGWFVSDEAKRVAANILTHQADLGGWPKNTDTAASPFTGDRASLKGTFDNGATTDELRFLARVFNLTKDDRYRKAFTKGLEPMPVR